MANREKQRVRRQIRYEDLPERENFFGIDDPTPYEAIRNIVIYQAGGKTKSGKCATEKGGCIESM